MRYNDFKIVETKLKEQQTPQNVADLATQRAPLDGSTRNLPIPVEIADPVLRLAPSLRQFVTYTPRYGIVGIKTVDGNTIRDLQTSLNRAGYDLAVDGLARQNTQAAIIDIFYTIAAANGIGESSIRENQFDDLVAAANGGEPFSGGSTTPARVYIIGDSHARAMGGSNNLAADGARLSAIAQQANRVPNGSDVYMTGGHNDVAGGAQPQAIASQVKTIIDSLVAKDCEVFYILFPEGSSNTNQENMAPTRQAITAAVPVSQDLEGCTMQPDGVHCSLGSYRGITTRTGGTPPSGAETEVAGSIEELTAGPPYPPEDMPAVRALQTKLEELGYSVGSTGIDGKYGPRTSRAVAAYLRDRNIADTDRGRTLPQEQLIALASAEPVESPSPTGNERGGGSARYDLPPLSDRTDVQGAVGEVLDFIGRYEARGHYDMRNGDSRDPAILDMTINEVLRYQDNRRSWPRSRSSAIGRYQYTQGTLEWVAGLMGVNKNTQKFDKDFQDELCIYDMRNRCKLDDWLAGRIESEEFVNELAEVWAAIPNSSNRSQYRGIAGNRRGLDFDDAVSQLDRIQTGIA